MNQESQISNTVEFGPLLCSLKTYLHWSSIKKIMWIANNQCSFKKKVENIKPLQWDSFRLQINMNRWSRNWSRRMCMFIIVWAAMREISNMNNCKGRIAYYMLKINKWIPGKMARYWIYSPMKWIVGIVDGLSNAYNVFLTVPPWELIRDLIGRCIEVMGLSQNSSFYVLPF